MAEIAAAARLTKGAIYHHFASKEELYLGLLRRDLGEKEQLFEVAATAAGSCRERLARLTRTFFELPVEKRRLIRLVRRDINIFKDPVRDSVVRAYQSALPDQVERIIRDGIDAGELAPGDPRLLAWHFVAMVEVVLSKYAGVRLPDHDAKLAYILDLFLGGAARSTTPGVVQ